MALDVRKIIDRVPEVLAAVQRLTTAQVLVGVPPAKGPRRQGQVTNATLAYIHENGSPARNIPARPFIRPGIRRVRAELIRIMRQGAQDAVRGKRVDATMILNRVGMKARNAVVEEITSPQPPFVPLKPATIRARLRRTNAGRRQLQAMEKMARATGRQTNAVLAEWGGAGNAQPLIDTGQLRASISYVVRG